MIKTIMLILLWGAAACAAGGVAFDETRYLYSIDKTLRFSGEIRFSDGGMQIDYTKPEKRRIVYGGNRLEVFDADGGLMEEIDLDERPGMKLHMQFLLWLYRGDYDALKEYFTIERRGEEMDLHPIPPTDRVIASVNVVQEAQAPRVIKTVMSNGNEITITIAR